MMQVRCCDHVLKGWRLQLFDLLGWLSYCDPCLILGRIGLKFLETGEISLRGRVHWIDLNLLLLLFLYISCFVSHFDVFQFDLRLHLNFLRGLRRLPFDRLL